MKQHKWNHIWIMGVDLIDVFCSIFHSLARLNMFAADWYKSLPLLLNVQGEKYEAFKEWGDEMAKGQLKSYDELNNVLDAILDNMKEDD